MAAKLAESCSRSMLRAVNIKTTNSILQVVVIVAILCLLPSWVAAPPGFATSPCQAVGLSGNSKWISCSGSCAGGKTCVSKLGNDGTNYRYCTCCGVSNGQLSNCEVESSCCILVARSQTELGVRGLCTYPSCASSSGLTCQLITNQPVCKTPPPI